MKPALRWSVAQVALLLVTSPTAAHASLRYIADAASPAVGGARYGDVAFLKSPGQVTMQTRAGTGRDYQVPNGCIPSAITRDAIALACPAGPAQPRAPRILRIADGSVRAVPVPNGVSDLVPVAIGTRWLLAYASSTPDLAGHTTETLTAISRSSGKAIALDRTDNRGVRTYPDLNRSSLHSSLCRPISRARFRGGSENRTRYAIVDVVGSWVLQTAATTQTLQRCGRHTIKRFGRNATAVLSTNLLAYLEHSVVRLRDLRTNATRTIRWPAAARPTITLADRHLYLSEPTASGSYAIYKA